MSGGPESGGGINGGSFPPLNNNHNSSGGGGGGEWPQNAFYAHPDGGSMGYGMEFALGGMNGSGGGGGAAADGAGGGGVGMGGDYAGPWGSADPSMNLESLWPQNVAGLFDSMLMPGYANSMEMVSGLLLRFRCSLGWKENGTDFVRASFLFFVQHGGVVTFGNGGSGAITPYYPSS